MTDQTIAEILYESELAALREYVLAVENRVWDLDASLADHKASFAIERAARERVEARAKELEDLILAEACNDGECITVPHANKVCAEARAILAARKGESNG